MSSTAQKVTLKSNIYKSKPSSSNYNSKNPVHGKSKSPISTPKKQSAQIKIDPNELFQKVCCPNCRYLFKILKSQTFQEEVKKNLKDVLVQTDQKYLEQKKKIEIQTVFDNSQRRSNISISELFPMQTEKKTRIKNQSSKNHSPLMRTPSKRKESINQSTYKFKRLNNRNQKSSSNLKSMRQSFSQPSIQILTSRKNQIKNLLIKQFQKDRQMDQFHQMYKNLPQNMQIPAYLKTLLNENVLKEQDSFDAPKSSKFLDSKIHFQTPL